jgi:hypothetical protein
MTQSQNVLSVQFFDVWAFSGYPQETVEIAVLSETRSHSALAVLLKILLYDAGSPRSWLEMLNGKTINGWTSKGHSITTTFDQIA